MEKIPEFSKLFIVNVVVMFFVTLLKLPSVIGNYSSPANNGLSGSLFGPAITAIIAAFVLFVQAFFLGYGGLTTLGANVFAIGIVGPLAACIVYNVARKLGVPDFVSLIFAVFYANLFSALTSTLQLTLAFGILTKFMKFFVTMFVSQIPLIVVDMVVSVVVFVIFSKIFTDSKLFSLELNDFFKLR